MRGILAAGLLVCVVLAGCADDGSGGDETASTEDFSDLGVEATDDTGVILGVVVDTSIRPIKDAEVTIVADGTNKTTTTDAEGRFAFGELAPGFYIVSAKHLLYAPAQTQAEVVAGEDQPRVTRLLLERLFAQDPYMGPPIKFEGFIQCGYEIQGISSLCFNDYETLLVPDIPPTLKEVFDNRGYVTQVEANWQTLIFELTWKPSAQGTSEEMFVLVSFWNRTASDWYGQEGGSNPVLIRFETGEVHPTADDEDPMIPPEGHPDLYAYGGIARPSSQPAAIGFSQTFTIYQNSFFFGKPPEGWSFVNGDEDPFK
jgi:hypothetical protein